MERNTTQQSDMLAFRGRNAISPDGDKIGEIVEIYLDTASGQPEWALVTTGLLGNKRSFVPLAGAQPDDDGLRVPYDKGTVKDAPSVEADRELNTEEEQALYSHYGIEWGSWDAESGSGDGREPVGHDTSGPTTDEAMTRSEEELAVGKTQRESGRARLRKYVVTEEVQTTVPVQREEVRIEREPITDANAGQATDGPAISEEEHEVVLHEEQPVVEKKVVPKERVRMDKDTVTDEREVSDEVRKERIEVEGDARPGA